MNLDKGLRAVNMALILGLFAFQMFTAYTGNLLPRVQRPIHVGLVFMLVFVALAMVPQRSTLAKLVFVVLALASAVVCGYVIHVTPQIVF